MHKMFSGTLSVIFVFLLLCGSPSLCGTSSAAEVNGIDFFTPENIKTVESKTFRSFKAPSLVEAGGVIVAVGEGYYFDYGRSLTAVVSKGINLKKGKLEEIAKSLQGPFNAQLICPTVRNIYVSDAIKPTAVARGNKIYVLFSGFYKKEEEQTEKIIPQEEFRFPLAVGEVKKNMKSNDAEHVEWTFRQDIKGKFETKLKSKDDVLNIEGMGSGVVMNDSTLVFPVTYANKVGDVFSTIIYSKAKHNGRKDEEWVLVASTLPAYCMFPAVVEWEGKLFMLVACGKGHRRAYESNDMGKTWKELVGSISRVWGNNKARSLPGGQSGFVTAVIGERKKVMLFTQAVEEEAEVNKKKYKLHLWVTDNQRVYDAGPIFSDEFKRDVSSTLLYTKERLFSLHEKVNMVGGTEHKILYLTSLDEALEKIKSVVMKWEENDKLAADMCAISDLEDRTENNDCANRMPTRGLVGYLSNDISENTWTDEYLCVSATATEGKKVLNGVEFSAAGAGAKWLVAAEGQNKRYHFANYGFTLVATVTINSPPNEGHSPLMGVLLKDDTVSGKGMSFGVSYGKDTKWQLVSGSQATPVEQTKWEVGKKYQVALVYGQAKSYVYVNLRLLEGIAEKALINTEPENIQHFCFAAVCDEKKEEEEPKAAGNNVTVANVFLYNRPLTVDDFKPPEVKEEEEKKEDELHGGRDGSSSDGTDGVIPQSPPTPTHIGENDLLKPPLDGALSVNVGVLPLLLAICTVFLG